VVSRPPNLLPNPTVNIDAQLAVFLCVLAVQVAELLICAYLAGELRELRHELQSLRDLYLRSSPKVLPPPNH